MRKGHVLSGKGTRYGKIGVKAVLAGWSHNDSLSFDSF